MKNEIEEKSISPTKKEIKEPLWLSISEAAKVGGVQSRTIRRAIKNNDNIKYKIANNMYYIRFDSLMEYLHRTTKLKNKFNDHGIGQYVKEWEDII